MEIQQKITHVHISDAFIDYLQDVLAFTRTSPHFHVGLSPRAGLALLNASRSWAFLQGRDHTIPEDLQKIMPWVTGHRLRSREDLSEIPRDQLNKILRDVPVP